MDWNRTVKAFRLFERILLGFAFVFLSVYFAARIDNAVAPGARLRRFWAAQETAIKGRAVNTFPQRGENPDFRLWSQRRTAAYSVSLSSLAPIALAVLRTLDHQLEVAVLYGTNDLMLNRAVGALHCPIRNPVSS
jgi:hypothetical protein